jgi:hypothetical protein
MQEGVHIIIFLAITTFLILLLGGLMILVVYLYQQKRTLYQRTYSELKLKHEKKTYCHTTRSSRKYVSAHISGDT